MELKKTVKAFLTYLVSTSTRAGMGEKAISIIMSVGFIGIFGWIILYCMDTMSTATPINAGSPVYGAEQSLFEAVEIGLSLQTIIVVILVFGVVIGGLYYMWNRGQNE